MTEYFLLFYHCIFRLWFNWFCFKEIITKQPKDKIIKQPSTCSLQPGFSAGYILLRCKPIGSVRLSVSVRPSVRLFPLYLLNRLIFELEFMCVRACVCVCHDHNSPVIKSQGHRSRSMSGAYGRGNAVMRSVWPRSSIEDSFSMKWMNEWKCEDFKCVRKPTESRLCLTHYVNKSSRWAK